MRNIARFGGNLRNDLGEFEEIGVRLYKKQISCGACLEISTGWFEELIMRIVGFWEASFEQYDERIAGFA